MENDEHIEAVLNLSDSDFQYWLQENRDQLARDMVNEWRLYAEDIGDAERLIDALKLLDHAECVAKALDDPLALALVYRGRANLWQYKENFAASLAAADQAIAIYEEHGTEFDIAIANTVKVAVLGGMERFDEARALGRQIRPHFDSAKFTLGQARLAHALGHVCSMAWRVQEALAEYQQAYAYFVKLTSTEEDIAWVHHNIGYVYQQMGRLDMATYSYDFAHQAFLETANREGQLKLQYNIAENFLNQARYDQALLHLNEARRLLAQLSASPDSGYVDLFEAQARRALNDLPLAEDLLQRALAHFQNLKRYVEVAKVLVEYSLLAIRDGTLDGVGRALRYLLEAESSLVHVEMPLYVAWIQLEQGEILCQLGRTAEAAQRARQADAIFADAGMPLRRPKALVLLADCLQRLEPAQAREHYNLALSLAGDFAPTVAIRCWQGRGQLALAEGSPVEAERMFALAVDKLHMLRRLLHNHAHQAGFFENKQDLFELLLSTIHAQSHPAAKIFAWLEQFKANALADLLAGQPPDSQISDTLRGLLSERETLAQKLDRLFASFQSSAPLTQTRQRGPAILAHDAYQVQEINEVRHRLRLLDEEIARQRNPSIAWRSGATNLKPATLEKLLDDETILLSYYTVQGQLYVLTATNHGNDLQHHALGVTLDEVERQWRHYRRFVLRPTGALGALQDRLDELWQKLIAPIEARLSTRRRLLIIPHRTHFHVPFACLYDAAHRRYLVERWTVHYAPSVTIYDQRRQAEQSRAAPLFIGYPGEPEQSDYLPGVDKEIAALKDLFPQAAECFGADVTSANLWQLLPDHNLIHFACHAYFDSVTPLESGMPLADGRRLCAADLYLRHDHLRGATVVLSACETGRGQTSGNDILGLISAFLYAGATGVVAGLWTVDDEATHLLMHEFYCQLRAGADVATALQRAQLRLLHDTTYAHPYYWAAFGLNGDSRTIGG